MAYTVDEMKNEIERLNREFKDLSDAYEDLIFKVIIYLNNKEYNMLLKEILETEYFNKKDIIDMLIKEREENDIKISVYRKEHLEN